MRKLLVVGLTAVALMVLGGAFAGDLWAQARSRAQQMAPPELMLRADAGSSIGAAVRDLRDEEIAAAKLAQPGGVLVQDVRDDSPAERAGLRSGDIVVEFDGERVRSARHFTRLVRETAPGRSVRGSVLRDGTRQEITVTPDAGDRLTMNLPDLGPEIERGLRSLPRNFNFDFDVAPAPLPRGGIAPRGRMGVTLAPLSDQLATYFGVKDGVLVASVETDSPAGRAGLQAGDVITRMNGRDVTSAADVTRAVRDAQPGATFDVRVTRDKKDVDLKVTLPERDAARTGVLPV